MEVMIRMDSNFSSLSGIIVKYIYNVNVTKQGSRNTHKLQKGCFGEVCGKCAVFSTWNVNKYWA